ncbi:MAG: hypothetical protein M1834_007345 [Cirrosporium novae-zelandiae]|nr:MAG: hypothetical protein M1834_007345 [Cirrosporium novae-zelandiae]
MTKGPSPLIDTVVIGNGPAALILSYLLHGHVPYYTTLNPHFDPLLHRKLQGQPCLLDLDINRLTQHFLASRFSYSTQTLPLNVLLDTLVRPHSDTDLLDTKTCVEWKHKPEKAVPHIILGNASEAGGQWTENPPDTSEDIEALSYSEMLSLPGYSFAEHYQQEEGRLLQPFTRPTRRQLAQYYATYPTMVGIDDCIYNSNQVSGVSRSSKGFFISSHNIHCKHIVLASGIFSSFIPPPPMLRPLFSLTPPTPGSGTLLIVGSGFSAADVILSTPTNQKIIHIYRWAPNEQPSPLKSCHRQAYPDYALIYRLMKLAAPSSSSVNDGRRPKLTKKTSKPMTGERIHRERYEGLPNATIAGIAVEGDSATICIKKDDGSYIQRQINKFSYDIGRRGSLGYLEPQLLEEVLPPIQGPRDTEDYISGQTLRAKSYNSIEMAPNVFAVGSLTGDTLVRYAYGSCVSAAGSIMTRSSGQQERRKKHPYTNANGTTTASPIFQLTKAMAKPVAHVELGKAPKIPKARSCQR